MAFPDDESAFQRQEFGESESVPAAQNSGSGPSEVDGEANAGTPAIVALVILLSAFLILLAFLLWNSVVSVVRRLLT